MSLSFSSSFVPCFFFPAQKREERKNQKLSLSLSLSLFFLRLTPPTPWIDSCRNPATLPGVHVSIVSCSSRAYFNPIAFSSSPPPPFLSLLPSSSPLSLLKMPLYASGQATCLTPNPAGTACLQVECAVAP